jgi:hypothetical protein
MDTKELININIDIYKKILEKTKVELSTESCKPIKEVLETSVIRLESKIEALELVLEDL